MKKTKGIISLFVVLLSFTIVLTSCTVVEDTDTQEAINLAEENLTENVEEMEDPSTDTTINSACESYEEEVESGICGYVLDCDDADSCEVWGTQMLEDMDEWFGELTYSEEWDIDEEDSEKEPNELAVYPVEGNEIELEPMDEDEEYYAWLWDRFTWIIPSDQREMISHFEVYDHADLMAYVIQDDEVYEKWTYAANQIQATYETERVMTDVHEFGHLLSLNSVQVDPYVSEGDCQTYMMDEGCPNEESYIYSFYQQFWEEGEGEKEEDYVTEYAMSSIYEDFAESWSYFVMTPRPTGDSIADQKVLFFYDYEDLIMLKAEILARASSWMDRNIEYE